MQTHFILQTGRAGWRETSDLARRLWAYSAVSNCRVGMARCSRSIGFDRSCGHLKSRCYASKRELFDSSFSIIRTCNHIVPLHFELFLTGDRVTRYPNKFNSLFELQRTHSIVAIALPKLLPWLLPHETELHEGKSNPQRTITFFESPNQQS